MNSIEYKIIVELFNNMPTMDNNIAGIVEQYIYKKCKVYQNKIPLNEEEENEEDNPIEIEDVNEEEEEESRINRKQKVNFVSEYTLRFDEFHGKYIKKEVGTIINPKIWSSILKYSETFYGTMITNPSMFNSYCTMNVNLSSPFYYGFEESALTVILSYLIDKHNLSVTTIPLIFEYGIDTLLLNFIILGAVELEFDDIIILFDNTKPPLFINIILPVLLTLSCETS